VPDLRALGLSDSRNGTGTDHSRSRSGSLIARGQERQRGKNEAQGKETLKEHWRIPEKGKLP
jgi:hypothetical protein